MKKIKLALASLAVLAGVAGGALVPEYAGAAPQDQIQNGIDAAGGSNAPNLGPQIRTVINALLFVLGAIAVIMIVIGGFRYVLSGGDSSATKAAKDTILYAVIGLIVAILAYAIVNFVVGSFK